MLSRLKFEFGPLVDQLLDQLPPGSLINGRILDPAMGGGQFVQVIEQRKQQAGKTAEEIHEQVHGIESNILRRDYAINRHHLSGTYVHTKFLDPEYDPGLFDIIISNPPYQDEESGNEKANLYVEYAKKAIDCLKPGGIAVFLTPKTLLRENSRNFSLIGLPGLKRVNFTAGNHFSVGVDVVAWEYHKDGDFAQVEIVNKDGSISYLDRGQEIADNTELWMYDLIKRIKGMPDKAFAYNNIGPVRSKVKTSEYKWVLRQNLAKNTVIYTKRQPYFHGKSKLLISISKAYNEANAIVDTADYAEAYVCMDLTNVSKQQHQNIMSFLFNPIMVFLVGKYRNIFKTGFANILVYLPKFNINHQYSDSDILQLLGLTEAEISLDN